MMRYLTSSHFWATVLSGLIFLAAATYYINQTTKLSLLARTRYPELWQKMLSWRGYHGALGLGGLMLFNEAARDHPDDVAFHRLLKSSRWYGAVCLISLVATLVLLGMTDVSTPH